MSIIPCTMVLNATSAEHLSAMITKDGVVFREWLADRLVREDDDAFKLAFSIAWSIDHHHPCDSERQGALIRSMLLRDCQERIAEYLAELEVEECEDVCCD